MPSLRLQELPDSQRDSDTRGTSGHIALCYVLRSVVRRGIPIPVVQQTVVGLVDPLPQDRVERRRSSDDHAVTDGQIHRDEAGHSHDPRNKVTCIGVNCSAHYSLSTP